MSDRFPRAACIARKTLMNCYPALFHRTLKKMTDRFRSVISNSLGITLIETVIALAMFSSAGTAVLLGVGAAHTSSDRVSASAVAENLARNQMEYVFSQDYLPPLGIYDSVEDDLFLNITIPSGFAVTTAAQVYVVEDDAIEKVVVTVTRDGKTVLVLESLRSEP